jgi:hypothetical protein
MLLLEHSLTTTFDDENKQIINEIHSVLSLKKEEMGGFSPKRELTPVPYKPHIRP